MVDAWLAVTKQSVDTKVEVLPPHQQLHGGSDATYLQVNLLQPGNAVANTA